MMSGEKQTLKSTFEVKTTSDVTPLELLLESNSLKSLSTARRWF